MLDPKAEAALVMVLGFLAFLFVSHFLVANWPLDF